MLTLSARAPIALLAATALAGCAVGPNYVAPTPPPAAKAAFLGAANTTAVAATAPQDDWWRLYDDPVLDGLIHDALAANTDVRVAVARIEKARAALRTSQAAELPSTGLSATPSYGRLADSQVLPGEPRQGREIGLSASVGYEVDLFGHVRRGVEAARADLAAAQEDADAVRVTVVADTVSAYVDAAASAQRLAVAQQTVALLDRSERITGARADHGLAERLDVLRVMQLREQQQALIPAIEADREAALFRLALLTGRTPQDLPAQAAARTAAPALAQPIPVGDGASLLARRPDVAAAERRLAGDTARIGVATADLYPHISLGGSVGTTSVNGEPLFGAGPFTWLVGPTITWAFPNQSAVRARIAATRADAKADLATFDGTVLRALEETETALSAYRNALQREAGLAAARDAAQRAADASLARQRVGRIDALALLDAERTLAQSQGDLAAATRDVALAQVNVFRALGGRWGHA